MDKPNEGGDAGCLIALICGFMFVLGCWRGCKEGYEDGDQAVRKEAVDAGHAEYDPQTGKWRWK